MKKLFNLFAAALVVLAAVSCEKSEVLPDSDVITLTATIDNGGTKTVLGSEVDSEGNYPVYWSEDDKIAVIQQVDEEINIYEFTLSSGCEGRTNGTFTCLENEAVGFDVNQEYFAIYPASIVTGTSFAGIKLNIPQVQSYASNSFGLGAMPMYAVCAGNNELTFSNLMGAMKLQLKGSSDIKIASIKVESWKDSNQSAKWTLSGDAIYSISTGKINFSSSNVFDNVSLVCGDNGVSLSDTDKGVAFMIALPSQNNQFFKVTITAANGQTKEITATTANVIKAGMILEMPVVDCSELNPQPVTYAYIENGVKLGDGVALPAGEGKTIIWAPVNCGYDANHKYGLLYQWGRKYGQGYTTATYGETEPELVDGPVELEVGQKPDNANKFYKITSSPYDWVSPKSDALWNSGSVDAPVKTDYDPCPDGWRVPTNVELLSLLNGLTEGGNKSSLSSQWTNKSTDPNHSGLSGFWFYGNTTETTGNKVFFPAAGNRGNSAGSAFYRPNDGYYWSSSVNGSYAWYLHFVYSGAGGYVESYKFKRALGQSVRCVKD